MDSHRTSDSVNATMTCMGEIKGKWKISDTDYTKFLDLLHDYLFVRRGRCLNLVEQPRKNEPKPLLIDLDFRYPNDTSLTRSFTLNNIETFVHQIVKGLQVFFGIEAYTELRFFVTLRPAPYSAQGKRKDGVHILCPDIALSNDKQSVLRKWILAQNGVRDCFKDTGYTNDDEDVYDESMTRKQGWIFYGESKPNISPYNLAAVFSYKPAENDWIDEDVGSYSARDLLELLSIRFNIVPDMNSAKDDAAGELFEAILRKSGSPPVAQEQDGGAQAAAATGEDNSLLQAIQILYPPTTKNDGERGMIRRFVMECLSDSWFEQEPKWIRVGWCLHNIEPSEEFFNLWMEFSAKSGKAAGNNVGLLRHNWFQGWRKDGDGPRLTERSLRKWARDDNKEMYDEIISTNLHDYIREDVEPTHFHVAKLMKKKYGSNYVASVNPSSTEWYKYDEDINMWKHLNQGIELRTKISTEVACDIQEAKKKVMSGMCANKATNDYLMTKQQALHKVEGSLYTNGFTEGVMKMAAQQFYEEDFMDKLNMNPLLFGCRNGVLELRTKGADGKEHVVFRQGRPEDYVSFLAGQNYPDSEPINYIPYDAADPRQLQIADFLTKLFPNAELRRYTLRLLASCLEGNNREQCYYTFIGVGSNGKSKIVELMRLTLGDYQTSMQSTVLTRKRPESGSANPDIMATKCRRFIYMQEPDDKEPINTSRMKQFSGEDIIEARALYGDQQKFRMMGKIAMMCNRLPPVNSMDQGTWRRIRVIPFESKFVGADHPELLLKKPNTFLRDLELDEKLRSWREPFLSLLVHTYETEYIPFGLHPIPDIVLRASNKYKESFDVYARFKVERVREPVTPEEHLECRSAPIDTKKINAIVGRWKKDNRIENFSAVDVITRLGDEYGEPEGGKFWPMIYVFGSDEDAAEWDAKHSAPSA